MIPRDWKVSRIDELGEIQSGRQRSPHFVKGVLRPYLRVANVFDGHIDISNVLQMAFAENEFKTFKLSNGDILLNEGQSLELVGRSAIFRDEIEDCCFQNTLLRFRPFGKLEPEFAQLLFQYLQYTGQFSRIASKTTSIAHLGASRLAALKVLIPTARERKIITEIVSSWYLVLSKTNRLKNNLIKLKKNLVEQLLSGQRRFPQFAEERWDKRCLGEFLTESRIRGSDGATARKLTVKLYGRGVVRKSEKIVGSTATQYFFRKAGQFIYSKLDFLNGAFCVVPDALDGYETTADLPAFDVEASLNARWLLAYVCREEFYRRKLGLAAGGRKARRVNPDAFLRIKIPVPSRAEQDKIVEFLDALDREIDLLTRQADALTRQKKALMQKLLTGQIRVKV
jgi:type I restriction enzyme S subunit